MTMNREDGRGHIELFADVLTDLHQIFTASTTLAAFRLMPELNTRQMIRECLTAGVLPCLTLGSGVVYFRSIQFRMDGADVFIHGLCKEIQLLRVEGFTALSEANPSQMSQLQGESLDLEFVSFGPCQKGLERCHQRLFGGRVNVRVFQQ